MQVDQLSRRAYESIRDRILHGDLASGQRLAVRELAESLGVSVTPVRDAFNLLAADGLVTISPRRGTVVASFTPRDVRELYDLRLMLEPAAAELAALHLSAQELCALRELARSMEPIGEPPYVDVDAYLRRRAAHREFHGAIVRGARNRRLDALYEEIMSNLSVTRALIYPAVFSRGEQWRQTHLDIVDALEGRDPLLARHRVYDHLRQSRDDLLRHMASNDGAAESSGGEEKVR